MSNKKNYVLCILSGICFAINSYAQEKDLNQVALMTTHDMKKNTFSNITITNHTAQPVTAAGIFIVSFDINDCSACNGNIAAGDNISGAMISPITFKVNQAVPIGQNYLYNMIYSGIYYIRNFVGTSPCFLPGCSWPGDDIHVSGWCIKINIASLDANYTYSTYTNGANPPAKSPPYAAAATSTPLHYKYDLVNPSNLADESACLGPIVCDDKALTCKVNTPQNQSFQAYS